MKKVVITLLCIFCTCALVACAGIERECETVPVVIKDAIVEPATVLKGFYLPEKHYLVIEYDDKYIWTIQSKEAYEKYKDNVGDTIEADVEVRSEFCVLLYKLEGQTIPGIRKGIAFESQPVF